jgi:hypothetical protein
MTVTAADPGPTRPVVDVRRLAAKWWPALAGLALLVGVIVYRQASSEAPAAPVDPEAPAAEPNGVAQDAGRHAGLGNRENPARGDDGRDGARASRRERARMRERLRPIHADKVKCCGRWALTDRLTIVRKGDQAYVGGTMRCGRGGCPRGARR